MGTRTIKETMYLKYEFDDQEKLVMAGTLASNHNAIDDIDAEEAVFKSQIKERRSGLAQSIQTLSRNISMGFEMRNIPCVAQYDKPNINEVTYVRLDTGEIVKTRPMTESERQQELEFREVAVEPVSNATVAKAFQDAVAEETAVAIEAFFGEGSIDALTAQDAGNSAVIDDPDAVFTDPNPDANLEAIKPEHDADWTAPAEAKRRGRPKGSVNKPAADEEDMPF